MNWEVSMSKAKVESTSIVDENAVIGDGTRVWNFVHVRENAEIGRDCVLGDYVYVGRGVKIGNGVKLENRAKNLDEFSKNICAYTHPPSRLVNGTRKPGTLFEVLRKPVS